MNLTRSDLWTRFKQHLHHWPELELSLDLSRLNFDNDFFTGLQPAITRAFDDMKALESGAIANPDENRMVGHYWLRNPTLAPSDSIRREIEDTLAQIKTFTKDVHSGALKTIHGPFEQLLIIGIGGSALGPQFVSDALSQPGRTSMAIHFLDNTDPDGIDRTLSQIGAGLRRTLVVVISKSGGTKETRNGMLETKARFEETGLRFEQHAVAITGRGSELDTLAISSEWLARFPMWDWVGGRTSELSAVGLLPASLQGIDIERLIDGARACDHLTRQWNVNVNPAALLALAWYHSCNGKGDKDMVILPYKDRLLLFSRYLQQLIMESLGKEFNSSGKPVNQGIAVYGNKGSTDQHAYVQQLREGVPNFFATFIEVLEDRQGPNLFVEPNVTSGDYLSGFMLGTREALFEKNRESITLTVRSLSTFTVGALIALYERAVGFYASLVGINAYHQPGVEAGKKAAGRVIQIQLKILEALGSKPEAAMSAEELAAKISTDDIETVFKVCEHLAANSRRGIIRTDGPSFVEARYHRQV